MSAIDQIIASANGVAGPDAAEILRAEDAAATAEARANPTTTLTYEIAGFTVVRVLNGTAAPADAKRNSITGKADGWDALLASMLGAKRGAETLIRPKINYGTDGVPRPQYATQKIQKAMLRLPAHQYGRVTLSRLDGSHDESTGSVTFGALILTVKPAGR